jgi:hypothetical protein
VDCVAERFQKFGSRGTAIVVLAMWVLLFLSNGLGSLENVSLCWVTVDGRLS